MVVVLGQELKEQVMIFKALEKTSQWDKEPLKKLLIHG